MASRISIEKEEEILYWNGILTQNDTAKKVGVSLPTIRHVCFRNGIDWIQQRRDQTGPNNSQYKDGLGRSTIERKTRQIVIDSNRSLFVCERCSHVNKFQEQVRHHIDRDRSNNVSENIEVLCQSCHVTEHSKERIRNKDTGQYVG